MKFAGFLEVYAETVEDAANEGRDASAAAARRRGGRRRSSCSRPTPEQHFTQPPPRFSEATLVKELEEKGIGRPSTYAAIMSTIQDRGYVEKKEARLYPTELGMLVNGLLVDAASPRSSAPTSPRRWRSSSTRSRRARADWVKLLEAFYKPFKLDLEKAEIEMRDVKREEQATERGLREVRQADGDQVGAQRPLPRLLRLSRVPQHQGVQAQRRRQPDGGRDDADDRPGLPDVRRADDDQARPLRRVPRLLAVPRVQDHQPISLGVDCPQPGCGGYLTEKRSRRGKVFFGCSN